jgi:uncharacterized RDD family membrane protein YckC
VDLDDHLVLLTPEGVELDVQLAGLGSRFIAGAIDFIIQLVLLGILIAIAASAGGTGTPLLVVVVVCTFLIWYLYFVPFEVLAAGRSPGKRLSHLRVIQVSGAPVDLGASLIRNLLRLVDGATLLYVPTILSIALSRRRQRPGDMAAGTVVIRDRHPAPARWGRGRLLPRRRGSPPAPAPAPRVAVAGADALSGSPGAVTGPRWDTSAITPQEAAAVRQFLARRDTLARAARRELALRLAAGLRPKVTGAPDDLAPERFLEQLSALIAGRAMTRF